MRLLFLLNCLITFSVLNAMDSLYIGLTKYKVDQFVFKVAHGSYELFEGEKLIRTINTNESTIIRRFDDQIIVQKEGNKYFFPSNHLIFKQSGENAHFVIENSVKNLKNNYMGGLMVRVENQALVLKNVLDMSNYLPGVIKAEIGSLFHPEFLKAMAIISRTYAVKNLQKHESEDYHLCDQTHCQVYLGRINEYDIKKAIIATKGEILVDTSMSLIDAVYHSNSGGVTSCSEWVWKSDFSYLKSVQDSFSIKGKHYSSESSISKSSWESFLSKYMLSESDLMDMDDFARREFIDKEQKVKMVQARYALGLRSSIFRIKKRGALMLFEGRGYGHGVGLSQEGAYHMSQEGYSYDDILFFYYKDVTLTHFSEL